jgi:hypothetical protein
LQEHRLSEHKWDLESNNTASRSTARIPLSHFMRKPVQVETERRVNGVLIGPTTIEIKFDRQLSLQTQK